MKIKYIIIIIALFLIPKISLAERITNFDSQMVINQDRSIDVTETITYDSEGIARQGIFRNIAIERKSISNIKVIRDGREEPIFITRDWINNNLNIRIGVPGLYFKGVRTYKINYKYNNIITADNNSDILKHNITGTNWEIPISKLTATIIFPESISSNDISQVQCEIININGTAVDQCSSNKLDNNSIQLNYNQPLFIQNGLEVSFKIRSGLLDQAPIYSRLDFDIIMAGIILLVTIILFSLIWLLWYKNKNIKYESVVQYTPPKNLSPAGVSYLRYGRAHSRMVSALMISLARQGIIKITQNFDKKFWHKTKYKFELIDKEKAKEVKYIGEAFLLESMFQRYLIPIDKLFSSIYHSIEVSKTRKNSIRFIINFIISFIIYLFIGGPVVVFLGLLGILEILVQIFFQTNNKLNDIYKAIYFEEFVPYHTKLPFLIKIFLYIITIVCVLLIFIALYYYYYVTALSLFIISIASLILVNSKTRRTKLGDEMMAYVLGLEEYIVVAEKHRLDFQAKNYLFFELLPYAIALGHEKVWVKAFEGINLNNPEWYQGASLLEGGFSSRWFYRDILYGFRPSINYSGSESSGSGFFGTGFGGGGGFGRGGGGGSW